MPNIGTYINKLKVIFEYLPSYFKEDMKIVKALKNCKVGLLKNVLIMYVNNTIYRSFILNIIII